MKDEKTSYAPDIKIPADKLARDLKRRFINGEMSFEACFEEYARLTDVK